MDLISPYDGEIRFASIAEATKWFRLNITRSGDGKNLEAVRNESYIVGEEVAAASWGYAGKTREFCYIADTLKPEN